MAEVNSFALYHGALYPDPAKVQDTEPNFGDPINVLVPTLSVGGDPPVFPNVNDVRLGISFGTQSNPTQFTGTVRVPPTNKVEAGYAYDANDTLTGSLQSGSLPPVEKVVYGTVYDDGNKVGVVELPFEPQVLIGVGYGAYGTQFEGTLVDVPGGVVTPMPPVLANGGIRNPLIIGDSYEGDRKFIWNIPAWAGVDPMTLTAKFTGKTPHCDGCDGEVVWEVDGIVQAAEAPADPSSWDVSFEMDSAATAVIPPGEYGWSVQIITADGEVITIVSDHDHDSAIWACI